MYVERRIDVDKLFEGAGAGGPYEEPEPRLMTYLVGTTLAIPPWALTHSALPFRPWYSDASDTTGTGPSR